MSANENRPLIEFDHHSGNYRDNWEQIAAVIHSEGAPIRWSESHGGFWVVASWEAANQIGLDWQTFTSVNDVECTGNGGRGSSIPQSPYHLVLGESDAPEHTERRGHETQSFTPKALRQWKPRTRAYLDEAIDHVLGLGRADLVQDLIVPTTVRTMLDVVGYDHPDWRSVAWTSEQAILLPYDHPDHPHKDKSRIREIILGQITDRRAAPRDDLISRVARGSVCGTPIGDDDAVSMVSGLMFAGFLPPTSLTANALLWLDSNPRVAERLRHDAEYRTNLINEMLRFWTPALGTARTATKDVELLGRTIRKGERILPWLPGINRDPTKFPDPTVLDPERANASEHLSFSVGPHRCLGSSLAKNQIAEMLTTIPVRLRGLKFDRTGARPYSSFGEHIGYSSIPVTFEPRDVDPSEHGALEDAPAIGRPLSCPR